MSIHKEYKKISQENDTAMLFLHGILGSPSHFNRFIDVLPENISICNVLLKGHGASACDFCNANMELWKKQALEEYENLAKTHENIIVVAHSMGTLFSIQLALKKNTKIKKLVLLAPPFKPTLKLDMIVNSIKIYLNMPVNDELFNSFSIKTSKNTSVYAKWIPNYISLFKEIYKTRKEIYKINIPSLCVFSKLDELVLISSKNYVEKNNNIQYITLENSKHHCYEQNDSNILMDTFLKFIY